MKRRHVCDVPGCSHERKRWQRLCDGCYFALPGSVRTEIIDAHRQGRRKDWRRACRHAGELFAVPAAPTALLPARPPFRPSRLTAEQAFENHQRLLGER